MKSKKKTTKYMVSFLEINKIKQESKRREALTKEKKGKKKEKNPHTTPSLVIENNVNYFQDGPRIGWMARLYKIILFMAVIIAKTADFS